jgi:ADP-heptose:LPS heptosyltransferase
MKRIVVYRLGSIGDTVIALPCFKLIKSFYPDHEILVLTNVPVSGNTAPLMSVLGEDGKLVDGMIEYPVGTRSVQLLWNLAIQLRSLKADALIYLMPSRPALSAWRDWLFFKLSGFVHIVGFPNTKNLRQNIIDEENQTVEREAFRLIRCLKNLGDVKIDNPSIWSLDLSISERDIGHQFVKTLTNAPYFSINMGGKQIINDWGFANWHALLSALNQKYPNYGLMAVGAESDFESSERLLNGWLGPTVNACGKLSPRESAATMEKTTLFIGHDSGPLHLASAMGVSTIGLFGNNNPPGKWHPYSKFSKVIHNMDGISEISVQEVLTAVECSLDYLS